MRLSAVGDVCNAVPLLRALQRHWPATRITWIIGQLEASLVGDIPDVEFIIFNKRDGWRAFRKLRHTLRSRRFELLVHMQAALRASVATRMFSADLRLGFDRAQARDFQSLFVNRRIRPLSQPHVLEGFMGFADALGADNSELTWNIPIPSAATERARTWIPDGQRTLVISPCSSQRARNWRNWAVENYARVAQYAQESHGLQVILTGGPTDLEANYAAQISAALQGKVTNLVGKTSLKELLAILSRATVLICPDSGPAHMASAVGLPVVGLYATSNPERTGPYLSRQWVVNRYPDACRRYLDKAPQALRWGHRVRHPDAMDLISISDVTDKLDKLLGGASATEAVQ